MIRIFVTILSLLFFTSCSTNKTTTTTIALKNESKVKTPHRKEGAPLVVIDPGHGAFDLGAHSSQYEEKSICLRAAMMLRKHLEHAGYRVIMTRSRDEYIPLKKRAEIANQAKSQALISIHCNSAKNTSAKGIEIFYTNKTESWRAKRSKQMAQAILSRLLADTGAESRGIKEGNFCVIRETKMPSILIETGFLTNEEEQKKLKNDNYLDKMAKSIADGLVQYFDACNQA